VALPRRPLFPGGLMPVTVSNEKLIQELIQLKKGGCAPPCLRRLASRAMVVVSGSPSLCHISVSKRRSLGIQAALNLPCIVSRAF